MAWLLLQIGNLAWSLCQEVKEEVILELGTETWCIYGTECVLATYKDQFFSECATSALLGTHARNSPQSPAKEHTKTRYGTQVIAETTTTKSLW